jgi:hemin uptake protein HemP
MGWGSMTGGGKAAPDRKEPGPRCVKVSDLLAGGREVLLEHEGQLYHLRLTANGKLILTK